MLTTLKKLSLWVIVLNGYFSKQSFMNLTTKKNNDVNNTLNEYIDSNNKKHFNVLVEQLKTYILND